MYDVDYLDENYISSPSLSSVSSASSASSQSTISIVDGDLNIFSDSDDFVAEAKCQHNKLIKCKIIFECCGMEFSCKECHNEFYAQLPFTDHDIVLPHKNIICIKCKTKQQISNSCKKCYTQFSPYYCNVCQIYDASELNYHCFKCKMCIRGNKKLYTHCDECGCCLENLTYKKHKCIPNKLDRNCSICLDSLRNGEKVINMICGHALHNNCYDILIKSSYKCPECSKTIRSMKYEFSELSDKIKSLPLKSPKLVEIKCNDCEKTSIVDYHYLGLLCVFCKSYNTYKIEK
jgi:hypothetical protein